MPLYISFETFDLPFTAYIYWNNKRFTDYYPTASLVLFDLYSVTLHCPSGSSS